jgi:hypothetical protein
MDAVEKHRHLAGLLVILRLDAHVKRAAAEAMNDEAPEWTVVRCFGRLIILP